MTEVLASTSSGKLILYRHLKSAPELESYVRARIPLAAQRFLAGIRAGCLPLSKSVHLSEDTIHEQRACKLCGIEIEDQRHFLDRYIPSVARVTSETIQNRSLELNSLTSHPILSQ